MKECRRDELNGLALAFQQIFLIVQTLSMLLMTGAEVDDILFFLEHFLFSLPLH